MLPFHQVALEEWQHLLEGARDLFLVWINHKNLEYIHSGKIRNSHQACWSLFFTQFNFALPYRPGSRNTKPDNHSTQFQKDGKEFASPMLMAPP